MKSTIRKGDQLEDGNEVTGGSGRAEFMGRPLARRREQISAEGQPVTPEDTFAPACASLINQSKEDVAWQHGAVYDGNRKKWIPYFDNENAVNGNGFCVIQADRDGDPVQRERYLSFCIFHETIALCGSESFMYPGDPKGNLLPYIFDVLHSVEFIDTSGQKPEKWDRTFLATR